MKNLISLVFIALLISVGFLRVWSDTNIFGTTKINSFEYFGGCWQGDVRLCDYDPFD